MANLLSLDNDTLSYLLSTLEAPDMARCRTSRALKELVDREWADENKEKHSLWERHCQAIHIRRLKRHKSWKRAWLESRCHNCEGAHGGWWCRQHGWGVKLADGGEVRLCVPCAEAAKRCAEKNLSKTRCAKLLPRLVHAHGPAGRAVALACGSTLGPKLERLRAMLENWKRIQALALERQRHVKLWRAARAALV